MSPLSLFFLFCAPKVHAEEMPRTHQETPSIDEWMDSIPTLIIADQFCSGVLIDAYTIATAYHCVTSGQKIHIEWQDGTQEIAHTIATNPKSDLALIKRTESASHRPFLSIRSTDPKLGDTVFALGHPLAPLSIGKYADLLRWSVSKGIISNVGSQFIQTDTALNPGNSGGPLVDQQGNIIGIVSHKFLAENLSFVSSHSELSKLQQKRTPMHWFGGIWQLYPSFSIGLQQELLPSFDLNTSFVLRDRVHFHMKSRLYWNTLAQAKEKQDIYLYPFHTSLSGRIRFGHGAQCVALEAGGSLSYEQHIEYTEMLSQQMGYALGWVARISTGGISVRVEGIPDQSFLMLGFSIDSIGWRGVF